jgi:hypothetical protein
MIIIEGEIHSSKNSRRIMRNAKTGAPFVAKSESSKADEASFSLQLAVQRDEWQNMIAGCGYPLKIIFQFRRATRRRFDYVNMAQGILDAMVKAEYIPDDCADYVLPAFLPYELNKNAGCDVTLE